MSTPATQPADSADTSGLSQGARLLNTFFDPPKTFRDIRRDASWWLPWLLMALVFVGFAYAIQQRVGFERLAKQAMEQPARAAQFEQLSADAQQKQLATIAASMKWGFYLNPVLVLFTSALLALIFMAVFNFGFEAEIAYNESLAVVIYSFLPALISTSIVIVALYGGNPDGFNLQNPTATNPAALMDMQNTSPFLYHLAASLDLFSIWIILLLGIGYSALSKVSRKVAWLVIFAMYFGFELLKAALSVL